MRAVTMRGDRIAVEEVPEPTPAPGQVLIAPQASGICGTDLHAREMLGQLQSLAPDQPPIAIVPGHEVAGEVVGIGKGTDTDLRRGDLVTVIPFIEGPNGPDTIGLSPMFGGGLAELTVADAVRTVRLPPDVDARLGALCEPVAVAVHAYSFAASRGPIVVVGTGPIGLGIIAVAALDGRQPIIAVEPSAPRRSMAQRFGAHAVHAPGATLTELLAEAGFRASPSSPLLDDDPAPVTVFECVGRPDVVTEILAGAPTHARVVLAGACGPPVEISPIQLTLSEVTVSASYAYRPHEFRTAAGLLRDDPDRFSALVTSERRLDETEAAFDALAGQPAELKILIRPQW